MFLIATEGFTVHNIICCPNSDVQQIGHITNTKIEKGLHQIYTALMYTGQNSSCSC